MGIQTRSDREKYSRLRQSLVRLAAEVSRLIQPFLGDKPTIKGSIYELRRKCGKSGCRCERGELHAQMVLSTKQQGRTKLQSITMDFLAQVHRKVRNYRQLRRSRTELVKVHKRMLEIMDEMEAIRREEMK